MKKNSAEEIIRNFENEILNYLSDIAKPIYGDRLGEYKKAVFPWIHFASNMLGGSHHIAANIYHGFGPHTRTLFTDHGIKHSLRVAQLGTDLAKLVIKQCNMNTDLFDWLPKFHCASLLHDIGMFLREGENDWSIREEHGRISSDAVYAYYISNLKLKNKVNKTVVRNIAELCRLHQGKDFLDESILGKPIEEVEDNEKRKLVFWAWIIRMADALDFNMDRAPNWVWPYFRQRYWEPASPSKFEWDANSFFEKIDISFHDGEIEINASMIPPHHFIIPDKEPKNNELRNVATGKYEYSLEQYADYCKNILRYYLLYLKDHFSTVTENYWPNETPPKILLKLNAGEHIDKENSRRKISLARKDWKQLKKNGAFNPKDLEKPIHEQFRPPKITYRTLRALELDKDFQDGLKKIYKRLCCCLQFEGFGEDLFKEISEVRFWFFFADNSTKCLHPWLPFLSNKVYNKEIEKQRTGLQKVMLPPKCGILGYTASTGDPYHSYENNLIKDIRNIYLEAHGQMQVASVCFLPLIMKDDPRSELLGVASFMLTSNEIKDGENVAKITGDFHKFKKKLDEKAVNDGLDDICVSLNELLRPFSKTGG